MVWQVKPEPYHFCLFFIGKLISHQMKRIETHAVSYSIAEQMLPFCTNNLSMIVMCGQMSTGVQSI